MSDVETSPVDSNPQLNEITSIYNTANPNVLYTALLASYFMVLSVIPFPFSRCMTPTHLRSAARCVPAFLYSLFDRLNSL